MQRVILNESESVLEHATETDKVSLIRRIRPLTAAYQAAASQNQVYINNFIRLFLALTKTVIDIYMCVCVCVCLICIGDFKHYQCPSEKEQFVF